MGRCGLPGKVAFTASRFAWALRQKSVDAREGSGKLLDKLTGSVDEGDGGQIYGCGRQGRCCHEQLRVMYHSIRTNNL